jgi:hypothetical protein
MFLRSHGRKKDGKDHTYWSVVETLRTVDGPRQRTLCYLGELNDSAQARWLKTIEVFNEQGETQQLKLFPSHVEPPPDDPQVARVLLHKVRLERTRQFGSCWLGLELWKRLALDRFFEEAVDDLLRDSRIRLLRPIRGLLRGGLALRSRCLPQFHNGHVGDTLTSCLLMRLGTSLTVVDDRLLKLLFFLPRHLVEEFVDGLVAEHHVGHVPVSLYAEDGLA